MERFDDESDEDADAAPRRRAGKPTARTRKAPRPVTEDRLRRQALYYLERYSSSRENLRRVLKRKVARSCAHHGTDPAAHDAEIDAVLAACERVGFVEDGRYARSRVETLRGRGLSARMILAKLKDKGVAEDVARAALEEIDARSAEDEASDPDEAAARAFAKRRRLGPHRLKDRAERRDRDLAALARGGFAFDLARRIIDSDA